MIFPTCDVEVAGSISKRTIEKGPGRVLGYLFMVSQPNLSVNSQWGVASQVCSHGWENRTPIRDLGIVDALIHSSVVLVRRLDQIVSSNANMW